MTSVGKSVRCKRGSRRESVGGLSPVDVLVKYTKNEICNVEGDGGYESK